MPDGRLVKIWLRGESEEKEKEIFMAESKDDGYTWLSPETGRIGPFWALQTWGGFLNLKDGSMLAFAMDHYVPSKMKKLGYHEISPTKMGLDNHYQVYDTNIWTWGSWHCQAYVFRSTDGGRTWSDSVNLDGTKLLGAGDDQPGHRSATAPWRTFSGLGAQKRGNGPTRTSGAG